MIVYLRKVIFMLWVVVLYTASVLAASPPPNIVIIYIDDLGYGDASCYGGINIQTPNIDTLAQTGLLFTDAHASAATCTPSRYSLLTGSYAFRNKKAHILSGAAPLLIDPAKGTLPAMLQKEGYHTAVIGKWHLGLGNGHLDWNGPIAPGPNEVGFDYSYIIPATPDRVPCVLVENHQVVNLDRNDPLYISYKEKIGDDPTGLSSSGLLRYRADRQHSGTIVDGVSRIGYMAGGHSARWTDETIPYLMLMKARNFISKNKEHPFFLYFSLVEIHVPRMPSVDFQGKSALGPRGDVILQADWLTGEIVSFLKKLSLRQNTLVILSSDNGPVLNDGYDDLSVKMNGDHRPGGPFSGGKYSILEGGTRMPFIVNWPSVVKSGRSDALVSQVDLYASLADLVGYQLKGNEAPDSYDVLGVLLGKSKKGRKTLVEQASTLALRENNWKYIAPVTKQKLEKSRWIKDHKGIASGLSIKPQLFDLSVDKAEKHDVAARYPEMIKKLAAELKKIEMEKHSRP